MSNKITSFFEGIAKFLNEVKVELKKVTWSTWAEIKNTTVIILFSLVILSTVVGIFDFIMSKVLSLLIH